MQNLNRPEPFTVAIADGVLVDLRERLARTRWPNEPRARPWRFGTDLGWMRQVADHWREHYDWRVWEARLNRIPNYRLALGGKQLHFMIERGSRPRPLPLLLTHGWPGSVVEFLDVIEPLAHPERFGGVVPSLPGFGFS